MVRKCIIIEMDDMFNEGDFGGPGGLAPDESSQGNLGFLPHQSYKSRISVQSDEADTTKPCRLEQNPTLKQMDLKIEPGNSQPEQAPQQKPDHPGSNKNKYIREISKMINDVKRVEVPAELLGHSRQQRIPGHQEESMDFDRLRRGRASAKNSRLRKKLYIDLLETKLEKLEEERQKLAKALHEAREGLAKASTMAQQTAGGFTVGRQHTIKKLEQLVSKTEEGDAEEVNIILDSLRYRISATGKERVNSVNEYFRQIANTCFPALNRYLMWSALERRHLFSADPSNDPDEWFRDFFSSMNLSAQQLKNIRAQRETLVQEKSELESLVAEIHQSKQQLTHQSERSDQEVDLFRNVLGPMQCARLILFIDVHKYRREFSVWDGHPPTSVLEQQVARTLKRPRYA